MIVLFNIDEFYFYIKSTVILCNIQLIMFFIRNKAGLWNLNKAIITTYASFTPSHDE